MFNKVIEIKTLFIASIVLSIIFVLVPYQILFTMLFITSVYNRIGTIHILGLIIILLTSLISEVDENLRFYVLIFSTIFLIVKNLRIYGFNLNIVPSISKPFKIFLIMLTLALISSSIFGLNPINSLIETARTLFFFVIIYLIYILTYKYNSILTLFWSLTISTLIISSTIIYSFFEFNQSLVSLIAINQIRTTGIYSNVNAPGSYIIATFPFLLYILKFNKIWYQKIIITSLLIIELAALILTASRSGIVGAFVTLFFSLYILNKKLFNFFIITFLLIGIVFFVDIGFNETISSYLRFSSGLTYRDALWEVALEMFKKNPLTGIGPGNYSGIMINYLPLPLDSWKAVNIIKMLNVTGGTNLSHNFYLSILSDLGLFGLMSIIYLTFIFFKVGFEDYKTAFKRKLSNHAYLIFCVMASGAGLFARSLFEGIGIMTYGWIKMDIPFWILIIIINYYSKKLNEDTSFS